MSEATHNSTRLESLASIDAVYVREEGVGKVFSNLVEVVLQQ